MKIKIGNQLREALGMTSKSDSNECQPQNTEQLCELQMWVERALAASSLEDLARPFKLVTKKGSQKCYTLDLRLKWTWPIPVALELKIEDEHTWEIELVRDETKIDRNI